MKIAVTSNGSSLDSTVSGQFGRCQFFLIVDTDTMKFEAVPNPGNQMQSGAGPKAAEIIISKKADVLLTGRVGDKAEEALKRGSIKIAADLKGNELVKDAVDNYLLKINNN